jgi:hypothetical protein
MYVARVFFASDSNYQEPPDDWRYFWSRADAEAALKELRAANEEAAQLWSDYVAREKELLAERGLLPYGLVTPEKKELDAQAKREVGITADQIQMACGGPWAATVVEREIEGAATAYLIHETHGCENPWCSGESHFSEAYLSEDAAKAALEEGASEKPRHWRGITSVKLQ